jgi:hypothetical protein
MSSYTHAYCTICNQHNYVVPLHGERGGALCCLPCAGKWNAEHTRRRRAERVVVKALKGYFAAGGKLHGHDFDKLKFAAAGMSFSDDKLDTGADFSDLTSELLDATIALTHPDRHPPERQDEANRVTQELLALKPFVFPAVKPEPPKPKDENDACSKSHRDDFKQPSQPAYPCDDCRDTISSFYCDACRAQFDKGEEQKRERKERERLEKNARQRKRYKECKQKAKSATCDSCGKKFEPKRTDAKYCCAACRQRAYVKRDGNASNSKALGQQEIERTIRDVFTCNVDGAFSVDDLCSHVYLGLKKPQRKHRAAVIPVAKQVCEQLGDDWQWWRAENRGGTLVFFNHANVTSYALARLRADMFEYQTDEEKLRAMLLPGGRYHDYVVKGGAWWKHCQDHINETTNQNKAAVI